MNRRVCGKYMYTLTRNWLRGCLGTQQDNMWFSLDSLTPYSSPKLQLIVLSLLTAQSAPNLNQSVSSQQLSHFSNIKDFPETIPIDQAPGTPQTVPGPLCSILHEMWTLENSDAYLILKLTALPEKNTKLRILYAGSGWGSTITSFAKAIGPKRRFLGNEWAAREDFSIAMVHGEIIIRTE